MEKVFKHIDLKLIEPVFASPLIDLIIELNSLRQKSLFGSTRPEIFFQLKHIFHTLESIGSARIEGNNTTIAEYIETKIEDSPTQKQNIIEIQNMENAMMFVEENIKSSKIDRLFISELHKIIVKDLTPPPSGEGDITPGEFRLKNVTITHANFSPPDFTQVTDYMDELIKFINKDDQPKYDLLKTAIAHHRFVWIHPFNNGNGRTVRSITYAMLVGQGFNVDHGRIINPTAVFCCNRERYNEYLSQADSGTDKGILDWCEYVLGGLKGEIEKIDRLLNYKYLKNEIILPAIQYSLERKVITDIEAQILKKAIDAKSQKISASDLKDIFPNKLSAAISREIGKLKKKKMLIPAHGEKSRKYIISFSNNFLLRGIIRSLDKKGFLPLNE